MLNKTFMKLAGFNLTKINLEKKSNNLKEVKISTSIDVLDVKSVKSDLFKSQEGLLGINFEYIINYEKDIASLKFQGNMLISLGLKQADEVLDSWKGKKLPEDFRLAVFNLIFRKSSIKALKFEEELNLPPHIPFPSFKSQK